MAFLFNPRTSPLGEHVRPKDGKSFSLAELQEMVGGTIEIIHLPDGWWLVVNDEGKLLRLPYNLAATVIYNRKDDFIVGNAVYCAPDEIE